MSAVQNVKVTHEDEGIRLDRWFKRHFPKVGHGAIEKALRKGNIRVDGKRVKASVRLEKGQMVRVPPLQETAIVKDRKFVQKIDPKFVEQIQQAVLYQDKDMLVLNKPPGLATQGGNKVKVSVDQLAEHLQFDASIPPKLVHRLDKDTSGVLVMARNAKMASALMQAFRDNKVKKTYWAIVVGVPEHKKGKIDLSLAKAGGAGKEKMVVDKEGKKAVTYYRMIERAGDKLALLELIPETGRTHQLRVHLAAIGTPILGDGKYGGNEVFVDGVEKKMHLHARSIEVPDLKIRMFEAPLSVHMTKTFRFLGFDLRG